MTEIQIQNISTRVANDQITGLIPALQAQITEDLLPVWGVTADLSFIGTGVFSPGAYHCVIKDTADDPKDAGFHIVVDQNQNEVPEARIFLDAIPDIDEQLSGVISHELLEMLVDPWTTRACPADSQYYVEVADPVTDTYYQKNNIGVSNFVTPLYYGFQTKSVKFDFNGLLSGPLPAVLPGGYLWGLSGQGPNTLWIAHAAADAGGSLNWRVAHPGRNAWRASHPQPSSTAFTPPP